MNEVAHPGRDLPSGLALLGIGRAAVAPAKVELERRTRRSVWSLQPQPRFDPEDETYELDARSRARGVDLRTITPPKALRFNPLLQNALDLWHSTWRESTPVLTDGALPTLIARQLDVARAVCLGRTDATIARQLGISERTVARDVATILQITQARSRGEAILNMLGRGRHST
ncbi:helix-turn-helix transcriptional regulator [Knoellia pratensis]